MNIRKVLLNLRARARWHLRGRARGETLLHVVGDSHTGVFFGDPHFVVHHLGPATAHNLCRHGSRTRSCEKLTAIVARMDRKREALILVFGEIDCRIHIYRRHIQSGGQVTITELIEQTITRYGHAMTELRDKGVTFYVYGIPPATHQPNRYNVDHYAPPNMHARIYAEFNDRLTAYCHERQYPYINVQKHTADAKGFIAPEFAHGDAHLNRNVMPYVRKHLADAGLPWLRDP